MTNEITSPTTLEQAMFLLPTGRVDKRIWTVSEMETQKTSEKWEVSAHDLVDILDSLPEHYQIAISKT